MNATPRAMDAMLRELMAAGGPGARESGAVRAPPDVASTLGALGPDGPDLDEIARAAGMDPAEMRGHAQRLWKHMDDLAERSPEEYRAFQDKQARAPGVDPAAVRAGGARPPRSAPSGDARRLPHAPPADRRRHGCRRHRRLARHRRRRPRPRPRRPTWEVSRRFAPARAPPPSASRSDPGDGDDEQGVTLDGNASRSGLDATVYDLDAHPSAVSRALEDASYHARLMDAATTFAERLEGNVRFNRARGRRCYTRRSDATPRTAATAAAADARKAGVGAGMSSQLLVEIASMADRDAKSKDAPAAAPMVVELEPGTGRGRGSNRGRGASDSNRGRGRGASDSSDSSRRSSHETRVTRDANGAPVSVETTFALPTVRSVPRTFG